MFNPSLTVNKFLQSEPIPLYIDGHWTHAKNGGRFSVMQPDSATSLCEVEAADADDVELAVTAGERAFRTWRKLPVDRRAYLLHRLADAMERHTDDLAYLESINVGKPIQQPLDFDVPFSIDGFRYFADLSTRATYNSPIPLAQMSAETLRTPYGVCGFIVPWNFPLLLLTWGIAPALAAGNTVVVKPAELTPLTALFLCTLAEEVGIPPGVINVIPGIGAEAGAALSAHPRLKRLSFTGSPEVGRAVARAAGENLVPVKLELGGKGAAVVFADADIKSAAVQLAQAITLNSGQVCCTATRWLIEERAFDEFMDNATTTLRHLRIGKPTEENVDMGPVISETQKARIENFVQAGLGEGATVLYSGSESLEGLGAGYFVAPSLLTGTAANTCAVNEIFGPVGYVMPFRGRNEAVDLVNSSSYGLANSVWSGDLGKAHEVAGELVAGNSWINAHNVFAYGLPYGGVNLSGLGGGVNSHETFYDYLRSQTVARPLK